MSDLTKNKYQLWITDYPLNGASDESKYDKGYMLVGTFPTIHEAVTELNKKHQNSSPVITKLVTWETKITDITDKPFTLNGATGGIGKMYNAIPLAPPEGGAA